MVHATITGFGSARPYVDRAAYDHVIQPVAGLAAAQGDGRAGEPALERQGVIDKLVGQTVAHAVTGALFERGGTGVSRALEIGMVDAALTFLWPVDITTRASDTCSAGVRTGRESPALQVASGRQWAHPDGRRWARF